MALDDCAEHFVESVDCLFMKQNSSALRTIFGMESLNSRIISRPLFFVYCVVVLNRTGADLVVYSLFTSQIYFPLFEYRNGGCSKSGHLAVLNIAYILDLPFFLFQKSRAHIWNRPEAKKKTVFIENINKNT
jgi:hypothetical protein